ncbi:MAG: hypothetical protein WCY11_17765, partial [Novosphingobium sp.]
VVISVEQEAFAAVEQAIAGTSRGDAPICCNAAADNLADSVIAAAKGHDGPIIITRPTTPCLRPRHWMPC